MKDPTFDIYVAKDGDTIRRMSGNLVLAVPKGERSQTNGITGGSLRFTLEMSKVNGDQKVETPAKSKPISDLSRQLGGAAALGAASAAARAGHPRRPPPPRPPRRPHQGAAAVPTIPRPSGVTSPASTATSPGDDAARERCRSELQ